MTISIELGGKRIELIEINGCSVDRASDIKCSYTIVRAHIHLEHSVSCLMLFLTTRSTFIPKIIYCIFLISIHLVYVAAL